MVASPIFSTVSKAGHLWWFETTVQIRQPLRQDPAVICYFSPRHTAYHWAAGRYKFQL